MILLPGFDAPLSSDILLFLEEFNPFGAVDYVHIHQNLYYKENMFYDSHKDQEFETSMHSRGAQTA